jgi:hypothetical protein
MYVHFHDPRVTYACTYIDTLLEHTAPPLTNKNIKCASSVTHKHTLRTLRRACIFFSKTSSALPASRTHKHTLRTLRRACMCTFLDATICLHSTLFPACDFNITYITIYLLSYIYSSTYYNSFLILHRTRLATKISTNMHVCEARANVGGGGGGFIQ